MSAFSQLSVVGQFARQPPGSAARFAPSAGAMRRAMCALVLEDEPVGADSRLVFESFPEEITESYSVAAYREIGGNRMAQPAFATYQGGNWGPIALTLQFRAGEGLGRLERMGYAMDAYTATVNDLEQILVNMERKVDWCMALQFPLERSLGETTARILARAATNGIDRSATTTATDMAGKLRRNDPPFVLVVLGSWKVIRGYVTNVQAAWLPPYHPVTARPMGAEVRLTIQPILTEYPTWQTIRNRSGDNAYTFIAPELRGVAAQASLVQEQRLADARRRNDNIAALAGRPGGQLLQEP